MKIGPIDTKPPGPAPVERKTDVAPGKATPEASTEVALSSTATGMSEASFDSAKVDRIALAIRQGQFTINAEVIADKLITNAEELLGRKLS